jgi:hypothetical protein
VDIGVIVAAWGRPDAYRAHLKALGKAASGLTLEYSVGTTTEDWQSKRAAVARYGDWATVARVVPVTTDRAWPLPLVYNAALTATTSDVVLVVGSDVLVSPGVLADAATVPEGRARLYTTHDADGREFVGPGRRVALPYCMAIRKKHLTDISGWDEAFADGICYDDNDFAARLLISGVRFEWCDAFRCVHQTHKRYHGAHQREHRELNKIIWHGKLGGYHGPLWPAANEPEPADAMAAQDTLSEVLRAYGYGHIC